MMTSRINILFLRCGLATICAMPILCAVYASAATVGYWELDGDDPSTFNTDSVNGWNLTVDVRSSQDPSTVRNTTEKVVIDNPDSAFPWDGGFDSDDSATNPASENFSLGRMMHTAHLDPLDDPNAIFPQFKQSQAFTIEGFMRPTIDPDPLSSSANKQYLATTRSNLFAGGTLGWELYRAADKALYFGILTNGFADNVQVGGLIVENDQWYHFAGVWDPSTGADGEVRLYVDGDLVHAKDGDPDWDDDGEGEFLQIGGQHGFTFPRWSFDGQLDEFRFSDVALAPSEFLFQKSGIDGDFDGDGNVDGHDFLLWQRGESPSPLSSSDLSLWQTNYGVTPELVAASSTVPEPTTLLLLSLGLIALMFYRR